MYNIFLQEEIQCPHVYYQRPIISLTEARWRHTATPYCQSIINSYQIWLPVLLIWPEMRCALYGPNYPTDWIDYMYSIQIKSPSCYSRTCWNLLSLHGNTTRVPVATEKNQTQMNPIKPCLIIDWRCWRILKLKTGSQMNAWIWYLALNFNWIQSPWSLFSQWKSSKLKWASGGYILKL